MTNPTPADAAPAWVVTGPTSGYGRRTALALAGRGTLVLVGRNPQKLAELRAEIEARPDGRAVTITADFSDLTSVRIAAAALIELELPVAGVLNNAGIMQAEDVRTPEGWDLTYVTDHLGPFVFTEALIPHLADGTNVVFTVSAVEDPDRKVAHRAGFRGARYISAEASLNGQWQPGGAKRFGMDAYATAKQCNLATVYAFAREIPRLRFNAVEPGFSPGTNLGDDTSAGVRLLTKLVIVPLARFIPHSSTPQRGGDLLARVLADNSGASGVYYDETGQPMTGSAQVSDPAFCDQIVAETRSLLSRIAPEPPQTADARKG